MIEKNPVLTGIICALLCEILFGLSNIFTRTAAMHAGVLALLGWRFLTAFTAMSLCAVCGLIRLDLKHRDLRPLLLTALFSPVIYFIGETVGISRTSASEAGILIACIPVVSLIASAVFLKKRPSKWQIAGISVTLAGAVLTVIAAGMSATMSVTGYAFLIIAVLAHSMYTVCSEKASGYSAAGITYVMLSCGAAVFITAALVEAVLTDSIPDLLTLPVRYPSVLAAMLYQGIGCSVIAFFLLNAAIARIGVNRSSTFVGASTVVSILSGVLILHEELSALQLTGAAVIVAGIYTANLKSGGSRTVSGG